MAAKAREFLLHTSIAGMILSMCFLIPSYDGGRVLPANLLIWSLLISVLVYLSLIFSSPKD